MASPHTPRLGAGDGALEAGHHRRARGTDGLGLGDLAQILREEQRSRDALVAAGCLEHPVDGQWGGLGGDHLAFSLVCGGGYVASFGTSCNGAEKQKGKLRVDSLQAVLKGGEDGKVVEERQLSAVS